MTEQISILMAGYAAAEFAKEYACKQEEILKKRFNTRFISRISQCAPPYERIQKEVLSLKKEEEKIFTTEEKGLYDTLWEIGEAYACGLLVDAYKIPICNEIIEVCEIAGIDPFLIPSKGLVVITTGRPGQLSDELKKKGIPAGFAGYLTGNKAKILTAGDRQRYLTKPEQGEESYTL